MNKATKERAEWLRTRRREVKIGYISLFGEKQGLPEGVLMDCESVVQFGDYYIAMEEIFTDIDADVPAGEYLKFYDCMIEYEDELNINYQKWLDMKESHKIEILRQLELVKECRREYREAKVVLGKIASDLV